MSGREINYTVVYKVDPKNLAAFKELVSKVGRLVSSNEPENQGFSWYTSPDEQEWYVLEKYSSSEGVLQHLQNIAPLVESLLANGEITRFEVFGDVSPELEAALSSLNPQIFRSWSSTKA